MKARAYALFVLTLSVALSLPQAASWPPPNEAAAGGVGQRRAEGAVLRGTAPLPITGPWPSPPVVPHVFSGDLRDLPQLDEAGPPREFRRPAQPKAQRPLSTVPDPLAQTASGAGHMPEPSMNFAGLPRFPWGGGWPPDTNGDVGPEYYIQMVNSSFGVYDKDTGERLVAITYHALFTGTNTPCDDSDMGDVVVLYDPLADRWLLTAMAWYNDQGPFYECLALSRSGDPIGGGWYFYALQVDPDSLGDYPKLGVWPDAYYYSANMYGPLGFEGARLWALDRAAMLAGDPLQAVYFQLPPDYDTVLPANMRGSLPPAGSPNYFASITPPDTLHLWAFHVDWTHPITGSTLAGPTDLAVADFAFAPDIPQPPPGELLDSLGGMLMMHLHYRQMGTYESLWVNHSVGSGGVVGVRWYEVRDPGGTPVVYQQGTYQPSDGSYRWMGSLATDRDGNMALGYSVSSPWLFPAIRYAGRLNGEIPGTLPQGEASLVEGSGSQVGGYTRWGDYSAMTVDPTDDCTFWYTTEYYTQTGNNWQTRIGSFRFPSCGQPKGWIAGNVYDAATLAGIPGAPVVATGTAVTLSVAAAGVGLYTMALPAGVYTLTAGPLLPGYPDVTIVAGVVVTAGLTATVDLALSPAPYLTLATTRVDDAVPGGNGNGAPEPGETGLHLWLAVTNTGATTATNVTAHLIALSPGVSLTVADAAYPDLAASAAASNTSAFVLSLAPTLPCAARLDFLEIAATDQGTFTVPFTLSAALWLSRTALFSDTMESGPGGWTHGGVPNAWALTEETAHSPTHAWSDSPYGNYPDNANTWLRSPLFNVQGKVGFVLRFWQRYDLEEEYDFGQVDYSLDGGETWTTLPRFYTGQQPDWVLETLDASFFDGQAGAAFRFHMLSDPSLTLDGWYIDDVELSYLPFVCTYPVTVPAVPVLVAPADGTLTSTATITFTWAAGPGEPPDGYNVELGGVVFSTTAPLWTATLGSGPHTWRVRAYNAAGYSTYSAPWTVMVAYRVYLPLVAKQAP